MSKVALSIICPLYNKKDYIDETIHSVVNQTSQDWELIIIDDGSTDGGDGIARHWVEQDARIIYYSRADFSPDKKGGSVSRNIGIRQAKGKYLMFLDADDLLSETCVEKRIAKAHEYKDKNLIVFNHSYFRTSIKDAYPSSSPLSLRLKLGLKAPDKILLKQFLSYRLPWTISNPLWKTSFIQDLDGFDASFQRLQDPELHSRALIDERCRMLFLKYQQPADVFIRMDEQRHNSIFKSTEEKQNIYYQSVKKYIEKFKTILENSDNKDLLKSLDGYVFSFAANTYLKSIPGSPAFAQSTEQIKDILSNAYNKRILNTVYGLFKSTVNNKILKRAKLHSLVYRMYFILF